jgi:nucleoside diphosphate kinase
MVTAIILAKPLAVSNGRVELLENILSAKCSILRSKTMTCDSSRIARHYQEHSSKSFFQTLVSYYTGKTIKVYEVGFNSEEDLAAFRSEMGKATQPAEGSIRHAIIGDIFSANKAESGVADNGIHCSDSIESGLRETEVWFGVPPTSARTEAQHTEIYTLLSGIECVDSLQYAGGEHDGTALSDGVIDLDYRLLTNCIPAVVCQLQSAGLVIDKIGVDDESGSTYVKFEIPFNNGKADIAVVATEAYKNQVSKSHLIYLVSDELKSECRASKAVAKAQGKAVYTACKKEWRKKLLSSIGISL